MNNSRASDSEEHRSLQILTELSANESLTQRDLSSRLGIALGLVNSYIKNLVAKGFITVKSIPPRKYAYYLTPTGFSEKTRLSYHMFQDYIRIYRQARANLKQLFAELRSHGVKKVVFAGSDEVAEIAYLTLQETDIELSGVVDGEMAGKKFFGRDIRPIRDLPSLDYDCIIVASYLKREAIHAELLRNKTNKKEIKGIFSISEIE